ncbi:response regulator transcription factor [Bogoriella caseilytica]|uniref:Response regulator receiver domain-containing protein n=1 Tax=Bogoriella caseilytica TaxID=56055 RepID=A0A3N2B929_9MICO|nr:response regulator transcription factor [Bogoriella caseilytica]ROR71783.1 response regulator receiver domain-containing protein [Bogoriella caseilytica]
MTSNAAAETAVDLLLYSDDSTTRRHVIDAVGRRPGKGLPTVRWTEAATGVGAMTKIAAGDFALVVLDAEAAKTGGMALARQIKTEIFDAPPVLVLTGRPEDRWLATWSDADAVVPAPYDPMALQEAVAALLREGAEADRVSSVALTTGDHA